MKNTFKTHTVIEKGSDKVYQGSYKKTSYLQLSLERRYSKIQST